MGRFHKRLKLHSTNDENDRDTKVVSQTVIGDRASVVSCFGTMSYTSTKRSGESSSSRASRKSMDTDAMDDGMDDRDETKRKSRNLSEKKRRDQFNILINELCSMVSNSPRKMDKSTVLKATIAFLKTHNELSVQSQVQESQEDWKPSFLSNEEFTHLMMESLDGFIMVLSCNGQILYLSESVTSLLGHLCSDLINCSLFDFVPEEEKSDLHSILTTSVEDKSKSGNLTMDLNFRVGGYAGSEDNYKYQLVRIVGYFKRWISTDCGTGSETNTEKSEGEQSNDSSGTNYIFIATGRLIDADLLREMSVVVDTAKNEFSSRHSLEWKFLFLDHRAPPIIGYLPFEVLGTSGYDYYHAEDLEKVASCHEALMQKGEGTSCYYRFLTKGQQWIWLQTRFYITYHQWNSKPEFIVCTHRVVNYADVMKGARGELQLSHSPRVGHSFSKHLRLEPRRSTTTAKSCKQKIKPIHQQNSLISENPATPSPQSTTTVTVALQQPQQISPFVQQQAPQPTLAVPIATFHSTQIQGPAFTISTGHSGSNPDVPSLNISTGHLLVPPTSQCGVQEQLLIKHAELQRQIIQQQEELRRISEQLIMSQCGYIQGDVNTTSIIPQPVQNSPVTQATKESKPNAGHIQQVQ